MRATRLSLAAAAVLLLAACGSDATAPVQAEGRARYIGGYMTSGNRDGSSDPTVTQTTASDTTTRIGGYVTSGN